MSVSFRQGCADLGRLGQEGRSGQRGPDGADQSLDWLLILNQRHLEAVLRVYVHHYNAERPHRGLKLSPPEGPREPIASAVPGNVCRRDLLGGLLHEYYQAAA